MNLRSVGEAARQVRPLVVAMSLTACRARSIRRMPCVEGGRSTDPGLGRMT
jgi:hypothetical protein